MLKKLFAAMAVVWSAGCVTVVYPPSTSEGPAPARPQVVNGFRQRVDVSVTNNCASRLQLVYQDTVRATLAPGQSFTIFVQRGITTGEQKGAVLVKAYAGDGRYLGSAVREYYFPYDNRDSWRVPREVWQVNYLDTWYGNTGGCQR